MIHSTTASLLQAGLLAKTTLFLFNRPIKAKEADIIIWSKESFQVFPDFYVSDLDFNNIRKISNANPQQSDFLWGSVDLVHWVTLGGDSLEGLLYKPENFDHSKTSHLLVYFYERYSDRRQRHYHAFSSGIPPKLVFLYLVLETRINLNNRIIIFAEDYRRL